MTVNDALTVVMHRQSQEDSGAKKSGDVKKNGATPAKKGVNSEGEEDEEQPMPVELARAHLPVAVVPHMLRGPLRGPWRTG